MEGGGLGEVEVHALAPPVHHLHELRVQERMRKCNSLQYSREYVKVAVACMLAMCHVMFEVNHNTMVHTYMYQYNNETCTQY